ncbi:MAG: helix-turn-helix domain-containing protein [Nanoarchaeota archaeon]
MEELLPLFRSKLKVAILESLKEDKMSPVMLAKKLGKPRPSISRVILELEELGWVKCTTPEKDRWRMYELTKSGEKVLGKFNK